MKINWLVTPYFFENPEPALTDVVPQGGPFTLNDPGKLHSRSVKSLSHTHLPITEFVKRSAQQQNLPVASAGDCCAALPVMAGLQQAELNPVLVWLDAHGDFNTPETSPSGFLGGMPLAMMVGRGDLSLAQISGLTPVREADVWLIGARDLDPLEEEALAASQVNRAGLDTLGELVFDRPVHLHIDNDIINADEVPANNYPAQGGPSLADTISGCAAFASQNQLCAISFSGWNGRLDFDGKTARACAELLAAVVEECG
jgi:arginase